MNSNLVNYLLILGGSIIAIYAQATEKQNVVILIFGIAILMFGIYRIASKIPSKSDKEATNNEEEREL
mgnify:CR=1 FL=1